MRSDVAILTTAVLVSLSLAGCTDNTTVLPYDAVKLGWYGAQAWSKGAINVFGDEVVKGEVALVHTIEDPHSEGAIRVERPDGSSMHFLFLDPVILTAAGVTIPDGSAFVHAIDSPVDVVDGKEQYFNDPLSGNDTWPGRMVAWKTPDGVEHLSATVGNMSPSPAPGPFDFDRIAFDEAMGQVSESKGFANPSFGGTANLVARVKAVAVPGTTAITLTIQEFKTKKEVASATLAPTNGEQEVPLTFKLDSAPGYVAIISGQGVQATVTLLGKVQPPAAAGLTIMWDKLERGVRAEDEFERLASGGEVSNSVPQRVPVGNPVPFGWVAVILTVVGGILAALYLVRLYIHDAGGKMSSRRGSK